MSSTSQPDLPPLWHWYDPLRLIGDTSASPRWRVVLGGACGFVLLALAWACLAQLDVVAVAGGKLVPGSAVKVVQAPQGGVVRELLVHEGDRVRAGQLVATMDDSEAQVDRSAVEDEMAALTLQARWIDGELAARPLVPPPRPGAHAQVWENMAARRRAHLEAMAQAEADLARARHERDATARTLAKLEQSLPELERMARSYAELQASGFMSELAATEKRLAAQDRAWDARSQRSLLDAGEASVRVYLQKAAELEASYRATLRKDAADARQRMAYLQAQRDRLAHQQRQHELRSPQDGVVKELSTSTAGAVLQASATLMTVVPDDDALVAEVLLANEDVAFVRPGQRVALKLAAYPFQRYGLLEGVVDQVAPDAIDEEKGTAREAPPAAGRYRVRVKPSHQVLSSPGGQVRALSPGMQLVAEVQLGRRSVIDYLLSAVQKTAFEAGHER